MMCVVFGCFKQKTSYEMRISDWSSDVCSSDLLRQPGRATEHVPPRTQDDPLMAVIVLPSDPAPNGATPMRRDFGGTLTPLLGGPEQRINRLGTRLGIRVSMPPMRNGDNGRIFVSRLLHAKTLGSAACRDRVWQYD